MAKARPNDSGSPERLLGVRREDIATRGGGNPPLVGIFCAMPFDPRAIQETP